MKEPSRGCENIGLLGIEALDAAEPPEDDPPFRNSTRVILMVVSVPAESFEKVKSEISYQGLDA